MDKHLIKLYKENVIDEQTLWRFRSRCSTLAIMCGQPKFHKGNYPVRSIVSLVGLLQLRTIKISTEGPRKQPIFSIFLIHKQSFCICDENKRIQRK